MPRFLPFLRYCRTWLTGRADVTVREIHLHREGAEVPATLLAPRTTGSDLPGWVILHGITRPGRTHGQLVRFANALASTGCAVLVPEVPEWRELQLAPGMTLPTIRAALDALDATPGVRQGPRGLVGFSFGAPQAITASGEPSIRTRIAGVVGFGGYFDLERTVRFQLTGKHEWEGREYRLRPDPYGRWIIAANYLTRIPGYEGRQAASRAMWALAAAAGDLGIPAWNREMDPVKRRLRAMLHGEDRAIFDIIAPLNGLEPPEGEAETMAAALARAARETDPMIEPAAQMAEVPGPVHLLHGRNDHLIPFSEGLRTARALPPESLVGMTVTRLFAHSAQDAFPWREAPRELVSFSRAMARVLQTV